MPLSPVHHEAFQEAQYPRCSPARRSFLNPLIQQLLPETNTMKQTNKQKLSGGKKRLISHVCTCFPVYSLTTGVSRRRRCASSWLARPLSSRPNRRHSSITRRKAPRVSTCKRQEEVRNDGNWSSSSFSCRYFTSILARVCMCSGWSLRSFPKAVRRVA